MFLYYNIFLEDGHYPANILMQLIMSNTTDHQVSNSMFQEFVMCKTTLYHLGSINNLTCQCLLCWLPFDKNIFAIIFILLILSMILTLIDLTKWALYYMFKDYVLRQYLQSATKNNNIEIGYFVKTVNPDLYFVILMISVNVNNHIATDILKELYSKYSNNKLKNDKINAIEMETCFTI
jgi:hypothetical protein